MQTTDRAILRPSNPQTSKLQTSKLQTSKLQTSKLQTSKLQTSKPRVIEFDSFAHCQQIC